VRYTSNKEKNSDQQPDLDVDSESKTKVIVSIVQIAEQSTVEQ
jgi:hypothetical protein